jgi:hypothetical protein
MAKKTITLTETELKNIIKNIITNLNEEDLTRKKESFDVKNHKDLVNENPLKIKGTKK